MLEKQHIMEQILTSSCKADMITNMTAYPEDFYETIKLVIKAHNNV